MVGTNQPQTLPIHPFLRITEMIHRPRTTFDSAAARGCERILFAETRRVWRHDRRQRTRRPGPGEVTLGGPSPSSGALSHSFLHPLLPSLSMSIASSGGRRASTLPEDHAPDLTKKKNQFGCESNHHIGRRRRLAIQDPASEVGKRPHHVSRFPQPQSSKEATDSGAGDEGQWSNQFSGENAANQVPSS